MAFISSLLKPAKHEKSKTKKGEGGAGEHSDVLKKKVDEKKENLKEHEEDSSEESECYSDDDSSDEENERLNENNKTWNSENNEEDEVDEEDQRDERARNEEVHKIYTSEEEDVSRRNSAHSQNAEYTKKKTKLSFNKKKVQSYFHKSYDKVSNAIIKTSKSLFKPHHGDIKSMKDGNVSSNHILQCLENVEQENVDNDSDFSDEDCGNIVRYLDKHINCEEKNEEIIKKFTSFLENNDHPKVLEELKIILDERTLLLKSLNYFKILSMNYKKQLNKSNNSYDILKSENEQLIENVKMLKKFIVSLDANTGTCSSEADDHKLHSKECSCEFLKEQETQRSEEPREHTNQDNNEDSDHNEDNGGSTERNKEEYESEALEPTSKEEEPIKLHINEEQPIYLGKSFNNRTEYDSIKDIDPNHKDDDNTTEGITVEEKETLIKEDIIIRKEVVEETIAST